MAPRTSSNSCSVVDNLRDKVHSLLQSVSLYHDQTEEWFTNPAFVISRLGSKKSGQLSARWLVNETRTELIAAIADVLHCSSADVRAALRKESYHGPLRLLVDDELWAELVNLAHSRHVSTLISSIPSPVMKATNVC